MVLGIGGPPQAKLTCLATVTIAYVAGVGVEAAFEGLKKLLPSRSQAPAH
jgi:hypothetical protein